MDLRIKKIIANRIKINKSNNYKKELAYRERMLKNNVCYINYDILPIYVDIRPYLKAKNIDHSKLSDKTMEIQIEKVTFRLKDENDKVLHAKEKIIQNEQRNSESASKAVETSNEKSGLKTESTSTNRNVKSKQKRPKSIEEQNGKKSDENCECKDDIICKTCQKIAEAEKWELHRIKVIAEAAKKSKEEKQKKKMRLKEIKRKKLLKRRKVT
ncbi:hypothetical protein MHBO_000962 [Bonamia ostreae]|uniref:Uncharacterized protein n=1 Tax=Bonamia ostreae TaxID=126728 RepID=A0ABV2AHF6_9EUKA